MDQMVLDVCTAKTMDGRCHMVAKNHALIFEVTGKDKNHASSELEKKVLEVIGPVFKVEFERDHDKHLVRVNVRKT